MWLQEPSHGSGDAKQPVGLGPQKRRVRLERGNIFQIVWWVSNDRAACHIFLPDYRGSLSQQLSDPPT